MLRSLMEVVICFRCHKTEFSDSFHDPISLCLLLFLVDDADGLVIEELQRTF